LFEDVGVEMRQDSDSMGSNYHVKFFGKGVDIYFQAQSSYQATPLFFQSMYIAFSRSFILDILNFQAILSSI